MAHHTRGSFFAPSSDSSSDELRTAGPLEAQEEWPAPGPPPSGAPPQAEPAPGASTRGRPKRKKKRKGPESKEAARHTTSAAEGPAPTGEDPAGEEEVEEPAAAEVVVPVEGSAGRASLSRATSDGDVDDVERTPSEGDEEESVTPTSVVLSAEDAGLALWEAARDGNVRRVKRHLNEDTLKWKMPEDAKDEEDNSIALEYKGWRVMSQALHAAVLDKDPHPGEIILRKRLEVVRLLLESRADPRAKASTTSEVRKWEVPVIHMAAASGHEKVILLLLTHRADANEPSTLRDADPLSESELVYPIHEAVLFNRSGCVKLLLSMGCFFSDSELVLAARLGCASTVEAWSEHPNRRLQACMSAETCEVALLEAVKSCRFPWDRLCLFRDVFGNDREYLNAFPKVAVENENAAFAMLRDVKDDNASAQSIDPNLRHMLRRVGMADGTSHVFLQLIRKAPRAAAAVLEALTSEPYVKHPERNPLPIFTTLPLGVDIYPLSCKYEKDDCWQCDLSSGFGMRKWQRRLFVQNASMFQRRLHGLLNLGEFETEVAVRVVKVQGLANAAVLSCLARSSGDHLFAKLAVHALLKHVWKALRGFFISDMLFEGVATLVMSRWILSGVDFAFTPTSWSEFLCRAAWCVVASQGVFYATVLAYSACSQWRVLGVIEMLMWLWQGWHRVALSFFNIWLAASSQKDHWPDETDLTSILLGCASFLHWWTFLYKLRAFTLTGRRLVPIVKSFQHIGPVFVIITFLFLSFLHFFWALDRREADEVSSWEVLTFLLTGDNFLNREFLEGEGDLGRRVLLMWLGGLGLFVFTACCLNLFIAVLGEMYEHEQERIAYSFLRERAAICSSLSWRPEMPLPRCLPKKLRVSSPSVVLLCIAGCAVGVILSLWGCMTQKINSWPAALLLVSWTLFHQAFLKKELTRDWAEKYLWFCANIDGAEEMFRLGHDRDGLFPQTRPWKLKEYIAEITAKLQEQGKQLKLQRKAQLTKREAVRLFKAYTRAARRRRR